MEEIVEHSCNTINLSKKLNWYTYNAMNGFSIVLILMFYINNAKQLVQWQLIPVLIILVILVLLFRNSLALRSFNDTLEVHKDTIIYDGLRYESKMIKSVVLKNNAIEIRLQIPKYPINVIRMRGLETTEHERLIGLLKTYAGHHQIEWLDLENGGG